MAELRFRLADAAADLRHQSGGDGLALVGIGRLRHGAAEDRLAFGLRVEPGDRLVDDLERQLVAVLRRVGPGEQAVALQHDALGVRVLLGELRQPEAEFEAGALPGQPADLVAVDLLRQFLRILRGRDGDDRVGMHVVDMLVGHVGVQRRIDRSRARIQVEGAVRQVADHLVLELEAAIDALQRFQLLLVERRETVELDRADIAAGSLDPEHLDILTGQRVLLHHLGRRVAAADNW